MSGTFLNVAAILLCGAVALTNRQPSPKVQTAVKGLLGVFTVFVGMKITVTSMGGSFANILKQFVIVMISLVVGNLIGRSLHLQDGSNRLGHYAKNQIEKASGGQRPKFSNGFNTASLLFCLTPLALVGALHDGLGSNWQTLAIKSIMDGLATMGFVTTFGSSVVWSALPVLAFQGTLSLGARYLAGVLPNPLLADSINATGGMLLFTVALVIFEFRKVRLADMLPSLIVAPLITWFWLVR
jgi:uncharacterized protein